jgi:hypothetical protein
MVHRHPRITLVDIQDRLRYGRTGSIRTLLRRGWPIIVAAALVLIASMLPWFRTRFAVNEGWPARTASAWTASTSWSVAAVLCLVAAALGLTGTARQQWTPPAVRWTAVAIAGAGVFLTTITWRSIPSLTSGRHGFGWSSADPATHGVGDIVRDHLVLVHRNGLTQQVAWGFYVGLASMTLLTVVLIEAASRPRGR